MNVLLFGASGMVGDGVLRWLIASPKVNRVVAVSRKPLSTTHSKLETVIEADMFHLQHLDAMRDFDACFFCVGASSVGMSAEDYRRLTYDLTVAVAKQLLPRNPRMVFEYISGEGVFLQALRGYSNESIAVRLRIREESVHSCFRIGYDKIGAHPVLSAEMEDEARTQAGKARSRKREIFIDILRKHPEELRSWITRPALKRTGAPAFSASAE